MYNNDELFIADLGNVVYCAWAWKVNLWRQVARKVAQHLEDLEGS